VLLFVFVLVFLVDANNSIAVPIRTESLIVHM